jgi:hypothetical protein
MGAHPTEVEFADTLFVEFFDVRTARDIPPTGNWAAGTSEKRMTAGIVI